MMKPRIKTFRIEVTPPVGDYLCGGYHEPSLAIERPLYMDGVLLGWEGATVAMTTMDFCYLCGRSHQRLANAVAAGAGIPVSNVSVHANHVHDAPLIDEEAHLLVKQYSPELDLHNEAWFSKLLHNVTRAVAAAQATAGVSIHNASFVEQPVEQFASSRRILDENGKCQIRWSVCADPKIRQAPLGKIDPNLTQVALLDADGRLAAVLNFYASHPQVSDGRRLISDDTVGVAREQFRMVHPDIPCLYFTGCAGDVTAGKFTTQNRDDNQRILGRRLGDALLRATEKIEPHPIGSLRWFYSVLDLPISQPARSPAAIEEALRSCDTTPKEKCQAAQQILRSQRRSYPFQIRRLSFGWLDLLFLPAEMVVEYQMFAKAIARQNLAVAAYGDSFLMYVPTDEMFSQGGYESRDLWTHSRVGNEVLVKSAIQGVLKQQAE